MVKICHCHYSWKAIWVESVLWLLCTAQGWMRGCKKVLDVAMSFPLAVGQVMGLLGPTEHPFLVSWTIAPLLFIMAILLYDVTRSACVSLSPRPRPHLPIPVILRLANDLDVYLELYLITSSILLNLSPTFLTISCINFLVNKMGQ